MIFLSGISKVYGSRILFEKFNLTINRGEKIGLVGPNGAGKTTLFSLILGRSECSEGSITADKGVRIGYLPQEANFTSDNSVLSEVIEGDDLIKNLRKEKDSLESFGKAGSKRYGEVLHDLEFLDYFELEYKAKKVLAGLAFKESDFDRNITQMSGGWQMRVLLAKLLISRYDLLLLDEPTNYLDLNAAIWLKNYLKGFREAFIMISHDEDFLNEVVTYTLVLENMSVTKVKGSYDDFQKLRDGKINYLTKQFKEQDKKRQQLQKFIDRFHGQPNKASQVRSKRRMLEKMGNIEVPDNRRESIRKFNFPQCLRSGNNVASLDNIYKSYGDIEVYKKFNFEIIRDEKAVLVGENGAGKSTLLKILAGVIDIDSGKRTIGHNVKPGYFSQTRMDMLNSCNTVFQEACLNNRDDLPPQIVRTILGIFLFSGDDVDKKVSILSGGEKSRLILAKLLINPPNFLLLDEPTTHLDVDAVNALVRALKSYSGTLIFISHDIHFVRSVANVIFEVKEGDVSKFPGDFDYYLQRIKDSSSSNQKNKNKHSYQSKSVKKQKKLAEEDIKSKKAHNSVLAKKIKILRKEKEELSLDKNVKLRILSTPRGYHNKDIIITYGKRLKEIEKRFIKINEEIEIIAKGFI